MLELNGHPEYATCGIEEVDVRVHAQVKAVQDHQLRAPSKCHYIYALDVSGSMEGEKLESLKEIMNKFYFDQMKDNHFVTIIVYDSKVKFLHKPEMQMNDKNKRTVIETISNLQAGSSTNMKGACEAVLKAVDETSNNMHTRVTFITDGLPDSKEWILKSFSKEVAERRKQNKYFSSIVFFGVSLEHDGEDFLQRLKKEIESRSGDASFYSDNDEMGEVKRIIKEELEQDQNSSNEKFDLVFEIDNENQNQFVLQFGNENIIPSDFVKREVHSKRMRYTLPRIEYEQAKSCVVNVKLPEIKQDKNDYKVVTLKLMQILDQNKERHVSSYPIKIRRKKLLDPPKPNENFEEIDIFQSLLEELIKILSELIKNPGNTSELKEYVRNLPSPLADNLKSEAEKVIQQPEASRKDAAKNIKQDLEDKPPSPVLSPAPHPDDESTAVAPLHQKTHEIFNECDYNNNVTYRHNQQRRGSNKLRDIFLCCVCCSSTNINFQNILQYKNEYDPKKGTRKKEDDTYIYGLNEYDPYYWNDDETTSASEPRKLSLTEQLGLPKNVLKVKQFRKMSNTLKAYRKGNGFKVAIAKLKLRFGKDAKGKDIEFGYNARAEYDQHRPYDDGNGGNFAKRKSFYKKINRLTKQQLADSSFCTSDGRVIDSLADGRIVDYSREIDERLNVDESGHRITFTDV